jgi:hypothetical protein
MRKPLLKKGFAIAVLAVFALVLGGAGCCQKIIDQCKMYKDQSKASMERAQASAIKAEAASKDAQVPVPRAAAAANKAEAAAARAEDAAAKVCAFWQRVRRIAGAVPHTLCFFYRRLIISPVSPRLMSMGMPVRSSTVCITRCMFTRPVSPRLSSILRT